MRLAYSDHLVELVARAEAGAHRLAVAAPELVAALAPQARCDVARLSALLDGSPLRAETAAAVDRGEAPVAVPGEAGAGNGRQDRVLPVDRLDPQQGAAVEYANLLACVDAEAEVAAGFLDDPRAGLARLHAIICERLVDPALTGGPRIHDLAVHDGAQGSVLFRAPPAEDVPGLLDELCAWLGHASAALPAACVAGVVHARLLQWQPFAAANGRLARAAARVVLRARGLDPWGVAVPERALVADATGYHAEIAATIRRGGDLVPWLELVTEALAVELNAVADAVAPMRAAQPPEDARAVLTALEPGASVTVTEYADTRGCGRAAAQAELEQAARAGLVALEPRTRGLRYHRRPPRTD